MEALNVISRYMPNTTICNLSSGPHITHFLTVVTKKRKKVEFRISENFLCRQQMATVNLLQKHFKQHFYCGASNRYYILIQMLSVTKSSII